MKPVRLTPPAKAELREAANWYRDRSPAVSRQFFAEIRNALELIEQFTGAGAPVPYLDDPATRRFPIRRFPYQVIYLELTEIIEVVAIASDYRRPGYWQER